MSAHGVYFEPSWPEDPKVQAAGEDAAWLYFLVVCWLRRNKSVDGIIPLRTVPRLTEKRNVKQSVQRLVDADLAEVLDGDRLLIKVYGRWYAKSIAKVKQTKEAARARWSPDANAHANASANATVSADAQQDNHATREPGNHITMYPHNPGEHDADDGATGADADHEVWVLRMADHIRGQLEERGTRASLKTCVDVVTTLSEHLTHEAVDDLASHIATAEHPPKMARWLLGVADRKWPGWNTPPEPSVPVPEPEPYDEAPPEVVAAHLANIKSILAARLAKTPKEAS